MNRLFAIAVLGCLIGGLAGCGGSQPTTSPAPQPGPMPAPGTPPVQPGPAPAADLYEIDPAKHVIPATPATGRLGGKPFTPDRVELEGNKLTLRAGKDFFADQEIAIDLNKDANVADGLKLTVRPSQKWTDGIPSLFISIRRGEGLPETKFVNDDYALTLELGKAEKNKIPGKIYLCLPDSQRSCLAGTFVAQRKRGFSEPPGEDDVPFIQGSVSPAAKKDQLVTVGYVGRTADGKMVSDGAGTKVFEDGGGAVRSSSFVPRTADLSITKFMPRFDFSHLPPGRYLVYARCQPGTTAWVWVEVPAGGKVTQDLNLDESKTGTVEAKVPAGSQNVRLLPTDLGMPAQDNAFLDQLAFSLGLEGEVKNGTATIAGVPPGKYQVRAGTLRADIEVTTGKTTTVELKPEKK